MEKIFETIFDKATIYCRSNVDLIHMQIAQDLAKKLILQEGGNERIIMPAIIMHDLGWHLFSEEDELRVRKVGGRLEEIELRHKHEVESARLSEKILTEINYPEIEKRQIMEIITGHDTRTWPISKEDMIVRDADRLSRYVPEYLDLWILKFKKNSEEWVEYIRTQIERWLHTDTAKFMARQYLLQRKLGITEVELQKGLPGTFCKFLIKLEGEVTKIVREQLEKITIMTVKDKVYDVKRMMTIYLANCTHVDLKELQDDKEFFSIATQKVGKTGYIGIIDRVTHRIIFHPDKSLLNLPIEEIKKKKRPPKYLYGFWEWHERARKGEEFYSYYQGMNTDGEMIDKFVYVLPFDINDVRWAIASTANYDDFFKSIDILTEGIVQSISGVSGQIGKLVDLVEEQTKELIQSEKMAATSQIAAEAAHEIKNPLTVINSGLYYLKQVLPEEEEKNIQQTISMMDAAINRAVVYINDLLNFSKPPVIKLTQVEINKVLEQTIGELPQEMLRDVELLEDFETDLPRINADPERLKQVFTNIIKNASEAMIEVKDKKLKVKSKREEDVIKIIVSDTGKGIAGEDRKHIFDPFFTTKGKGTGLGLAICQRIIEAHKGEIEIESEVGKGTRFIIRLCIPSNSHYGLE